jgi:hypothetical protein
VNKLITFLDSNMQAHVPHNEKIAVEKVKTTIKKKVSVRWGGALRGLLCNFVIHTKVISNMHQSNKQINAQLCRKLTVVTEDLKEFRTSQRTTFSKKIKVSQRSANLVRITRRISNSDNNKKTKQTKQKNRARFHFCPNIAMRATCHV